MIVADALEDYLSDNSELLSELPAKNGTRQFLLSLPRLPEGRSLGRAWLELPEAFPESACAQIKLSSENVLKVPHVESDGKICFGIGDPGPSSGALAVDRIQQLLSSFYEQFLQPWSAGELDGDFLDESQSYWLIYCKRQSSPHDAVMKIYTLNERPSEPNIYFSTYFKDHRVVITHEEVESSSAFVIAMGQGKSISKVLVADIPVDFALTPKTWPKKQTDMTRLLRTRFGKEKAEQFLSKTGRRGRAIHRVVILRAPNCSFGYLLPGGPPNIVRQYLSFRAYPNAKLLPLLVERIDPSWTYGRDQHQEVSNRQQKHVLVIGAGALGSPVIAQLAKTGVGTITILDDDSLSTANIGRHMLGADSIGKSKSVTLSKEYELRWPSCKFIAEHKSLQTWLKDNTLSGVDMVIDLTGEPEVRLSIDVARRQNSCLLVIGWMEPYVAAAHACIFPKDKYWMLDSTDRLESLQAVTWPKDVIQQEPSCSSTFQSYTSAAAAHAVALVTEATIDLLDGKINSSIVRHWIRGQRFLDDCYPGLGLRDWALEAAPFDGVSLAKDYE